MLKVIVLAGLVGLCTSFSCDKLSKVGCMQRNPDVFPDMLANNRDRTSNVFIGNKINWRAFESSLTELACACAMKAKERGYVAFALGFYGECHGAKNQETYDAWLDSKNQASNGCINHSYGNCTDDDKKCVGKINAEYVYTFQSQAPEVIDGEFGEWSPYAECSASCGQGFQERERACNNPKPDNGGKDCVGEATETRACQLRECPVNGDYGKWSNYGECSKSCGGGNQERTRKCDSPAPAHGGEDCVGLSRDSKACNSQECPSNGEYGKWSSYGECSKSCGGGIQERTRKCDSPAPAHGGEDCVGLSRESKPCNTQGCPINGGYTPWGAYGSCSKTCGSGSQVSTRQCTNPRPQNGGTPCLGSASRSRNCNTQPCLESNQCEYKYTNFDSDGESKPIYLDRHSLHCSNGYVMNAIVLQRNSKGDKIRYRYRCCKAQLLCQDSRTKNAGTYNGGGLGDTIYLDRQTINCYDKGLSYLKLDRSGTNWNYKYDCCKTQYSSSTVNCYNTNTGFSDDGKGESIYLDRHNIACNTNYFITKFNLVRNSEGNQYRYDVRCCKINKPAVKN